MVETRHQSASNEENLRSLKPLEEGEVLLTPTIHQSEETIAEALKLVNSGASTLGFTSEDIQAFLRQHSVELQHPTESKPLTSYHPAVLDPSLSKTTENSVFDLRSLAKDRFLTSTKKNKERFDRLDRILGIKAFTSSKPTKSKAPCHYFARGSCKFGDTCKYAHGDLTSPKKNPTKTPFLATSIVPSHIPQPSQEPNKAVVHSYISPRNRQIVGPSLPRGDPNNPLGLSRNQRVKLSALTQDEAMDSWVDQSHCTHVARDSNGNPYLGVFTVGSTSSSTLSASFNSPQPHP